MFLELYRRSLSRLGRWFRKKWARQYQVARSDFWWPADWSISLQQPRCVWICPTAAKSLSFNLRWRRKDLVLKCQFQIFSEWLDRCFLDATSCRPAHLSLQKGCRRLPPLAHRLHPCSHRWSPILLHLKTLWTDTCLALSSYPIHVPPRSRLASEFNLNRPSSISSSASSLYCAALSSRSLTLQHRSSLFFNRTRTPSQCPYLALTSRSARRRSALLSSCKCWDQARGRVNSSAGSKRLSIGSRAWIAFFGLLHSSRFLGQLPIFLLFIVFF